MFRENKKKPDSSQKIQFHIYTHVYIGTFRTNNSMMIYSATKKSSFGVAPISESFLNTYPAISSSHCQGSCD